MREYDVYSLPSSMDLTKIKGKVTKKFRLGNEKEENETLVYFDSFDWRLYNNGYALRCLGRRWQLIHLVQEPVIELMQGPRPGKKMIPANFPPSKLRTLVQPLLDVRALLPLVTLKRQTVSWRMFNKDSKTVAILSLFRVQAQDSEQIYQSVRIEGVRGYDTHVQEVHSFLNSLGIVEPSSSIDGFEQGLLELGRRPGDYTSKFFVTLQPDLPAQQAVKKIYRQLLVTMKRNEVGILDDLDSEFLHDFRVAIRRTRSGLTLLKGVLPLEVTEQAQKDFSYLGKITGPTRDLDVYQLYEENYKSRLPPLYQSRLQSFFADLAVQRKNEQRKLVLALQDSRYASMMAHWQEYLSTEDGEVSDKGAMPVIDLACSVIFNRYKKVMKEGLLITPMASDDHLHRLRIQGKKLRYSIEFFSSLFPKKDVNKVLKQLKLLQNKLGDFNDLSVQQEMLHHYLGSLRPGSRINFELATAIGGLLTNLYHEQNRVREAVFASFHRFSGSLNGRLFKKLFT